jgi:formate-dependent phosphoribosylglycinamide formyltransferase (GAR transformylase)
MPDLSQMEEALAEAREDVKHFNKVVVDGTRGLKNAKARAYDIEQEIETYREREREKTI